MLSLRLTSMFSQSRVIAALLLAAIAWGSTVEFTHHHGASSTQPDGQTFASNADIDQTSVQSPQSSRSSSSSKTSECSICQLHHNLATTLISKLADARSESIQAATRVEAATVPLSEFTATRHGRAPPSIL